MANNHNLMSKVPPTYFDPYWYCKNQDSLTKEQREYFVTKAAEENLVPVLFAGGQHNGSLGFIKVENQQTAPTPQTEIEENAVNAAQIVFDLLRPLYHEIGFPKVTVYMNGTAYGTSISLPAIIAALQHIFDLHLPDGIIATGCLENGVLVPVSENTLSDKIAVAKNFGYKKLLLVEGQKGTENCPLEIIEVNADPIHAIFDLLLLRGVIPKDRHLARLLFAYDQKEGRSLDTEPLKKFLNNKSKLIRYITHDIFSRNALHQGKTETSKKYRQQIGTLEWYEIPSGYIGHYIRYEQVAATAVLEVDLGIWNDNAGIHSELDKRLNHLKNAIDGKFADRNDYLTALALANTRALRRRFLARLEQTPKRFESAWNDLIFLFDDWKEIFNYAQQRLKKKNDTLQRQRNYCLEALTDYWNIYKTLPKWNGVDMFLDSCTKDFKKSNKWNDVFNKIAEFNYRTITKQPLTEKELATFIKRAQANFSETNKYPNFILYENVLRFYPNTEQREFCLDKLAEVLPELTKEQSSIFNVLALRTRQILLNNGRKVPEPVLPNEGTELRNIADKLLSEPKTLIERCPY
jgi:hypothetical protein